jgi:ABC-type proline/glycine betaine transport system permease subunit
MVEYGNGVSGVSGQVSGGASDLGRTVDVGASASQFITESVQTLSTLPPAALLALVVVVFVGLIVLKRAF